jgi:hypothetical protein
VEEIDERARVAPVAARDRVRWGPIWAGLITTFTLFLILELLLYSVGALSFQFNSGTVGVSAPWVTALVGLLAFFVGGWVAEATSAVRGTSAGLLNGFLVWGLGTVAILLLSSFGMGTFFGMLGQAVSLIVGRIAFDALGNPGISPDQIRELARSAAWWAFLSMILSAIAAALGGWAGSKSGPIGDIARADRAR